MSTVKSAMRGVPVTLQAAGSTTGNGTAIAIPSSFRQHKITINGSAGIASGSIQPETADDPTFAGTWNPLGGGPINAVASAELEYNFSGIISAIRARLSANIVGGSVTVTYVGS